MDSPADQLGHPNPSEAPVTEMLHRPHDSADRHDRHAGNWPVPAADRLPHVGRARSRARRRRRRTRAPATSWRARCSAWPSGTGGSRRASSRGVLTREPDLTLDEPAPSGLHVDAVLERRSGDRDEARRRARRRWVCGPGSRPSCSPRRAAGRGPAATVSGSADRHRGGAAARARRGTGPRRAESRSPRCSASRDRAPPPRRPTSERTAQSSVCADGCASRGPTTADVTAPRPARGAVELDAATRRAHPVKRQWTSAP